MYGMRFIFSEFNVILFLLRYILHSIKFTILSLAVLVLAMQSCSCHCNQEREHFHCPKMFPCALGFFEPNKIPFKLPQNFNFVNACLL